MQPREGKFDSSVTRP
nr:unnamed protein product [Callosobruchus chinensis]